VSTGIFKEPVEGPVAIGHLNVDRDRQADLTVHGGWQKAVYAYSAQAYNAWRAARPDLDLPYGAFGENLTIGGLDERDVFVGDRLRIGGVELVVTEPRLPCFKLGIRLGSDEIPAEFFARGLFGFYLAVARPGLLQAGDMIEFVHRHEARLPVARIAELFRDRDDIAGMREAATLRAVPESWRDWFRAELARVGRRTGRALAPPGPRPAWEGTRELVVRERTVETNDVVSLGLAAADGSALPGYLPGQHLTLALLLADGETLTRSYSLSDVFRGHYRITIKRAGRAANHIHDRLQVGDVVAARAPGGSFIVDPRESHRPVVLAGAGIGFTPLAAMLNAIVDHGTPRQTWVFYGVRTAGDALWREQLETIANAHPEIRITILQSRPDNGARPRRLGIDLLRRELPASYYDFYLCGPASFMDELHDGLLAWGVPEHRIHFEAFGPASVRRRQAEPVGVRGSPVRFARSGATAEWDGDGTLLDLADDNAVRIPSGCRAGSCGTCATRLLSGEAAYEHQPSAFAKARQIFPCVAVPRGPITLDA
jgi:ferredoxin-NADP reductase/MOSC domain-containing protein YiiM